MNRVVVAGALANKVGSGGEAWVRMSWLRGLQLLGFETWFVEELSVVEQEAPGPERERAIAYFREVTTWFGVADRASLLADGDVVVGPPLDDLERFAAGAALVNISGHLGSPTFLERFATLVYVDIDPGFTQLWHADGHDLGLAVHDVHFTIGEHIGTSRCPIPTGGFRWEAVRQPVILDDWPVAPHGNGDRTDPFRFTTVSNWRSFGAPSLDGRAFELKHHQFRRFADLPRLVPSARFEIALAIDPADAADRERLTSSGWVITDPADLASPDEFRAYVAGSGAEFSVAQGVYVDTTCGWFSDRTVRYLASGRPALVQDTGLEGLLPLGDGLVVFSDLDGAVAGATSIVASPQAHREAARQLAVDHFAHDRALAPVADVLG